MIIALAVTAILTSGVALAINQMFGINAATSNRIVAVTQIQNAGYRISRDAEMAQTIISGDDPEDSGFPLTFIWTDWDGVGYKVVYRLDADNWYIIREYYIKPAETGAEFSSAPDITSVVARYIDPNPENTFCSPQPGGRIILKITATVGGFKRVTEQRTYDVAPRPSI